MISCTLGTLDQVGERMCSSLSVQNAELVRSEVAKLKAVFRPSLIDPCLHRFILSELDHETHGKRGMGRMSAHIPRLGAYYRSQMSRLSADEKASLYILIQHLVLSGYINAVGIWEEDAKQDDLDDPQELFRAWVPLIYVVGASDRSKQIRELVDLFTEGPLLALESFMNAHDMRGFLTVTRRTILSKYVDAGLLLRRVEVIPEMRDFGRQAFIVP